MDKTQETDFSDIKALYLNCSIKQKSSESHTQILMDKSANIMKAEGVEVEHVYALDSQIAFGMIKDGNDEGLKDEWPAIQQKIKEADILVIGSPIWLGVKSSVATLAVERMDA